LKLQDISLADEATLHTGGLRTPPADHSMSMAYSNPVLSGTYDSHVALARQPHNSLAQTGRPAGMLCDVALNQFARAQPQQQQPHIQQQARAASSTLVPHPHSSSSRHSTRPSTPSSTATSTHNEGTVSRRDSAMVGHSLQLPQCISPNGGSLDEFAASVSPVLPQVR
jgi:hypothetical protein